MSVYSSTRIFGQHAEPARPDELKWQDASLCSQSDPEAWFPEKGGSVRAPKLTCRRCPVQGECLGLALENDERYGVWGAASERERRRLKNKFGDDTAAAVASFTARPVSGPQARRALAA